MTQQQQAGYSGCSGPNGPAGPAIVHWQSPPSTVTMAAVAVAVVLLMMEGVTMSPRHHRAKPESHGGSDPPGLGQEQRSDMI